MASLAPGLPHLLAFPPISACTGFSQLRRGSWLTSTALVTFSGTFRCFT